MAAAVANNQGSGILRQRAVRLGQFADAMHISSVGAMRRPLWQRRSRDWLCLLKLGQRQECFDQLHAVLERQPELAGARAADQRTRVTLMC
jgi:hypothetical protein